jgi:hypothetical protein
VQVRCGDDRAWVGTVQATVAGTFATADWRVVAELRTMGGALHAQQPTAQWVPGGVRMALGRVQTAALQPGAYKLALRLERVADGYTITSNPATLRVEGRL